MKIMKTNYIRLFFTGMLIFLLYACFEDKGNYDYEYVQEVELLEKQGGFKDTVISRGQRLAIVPNLQLLLKEGDKVKDTVEFESERYQYEWKAGQYFISSGYTILGTSRNLDTVINLPIQNDPYLIIYTVTNKESKVSRSFTFNLRVANRYETAWLFLTENDDQMADITIYGKEIGNTSENPWVYEDHILERSGFPYRGGGAKFVYYHKTIAKPVKEFIYVGTGESAGWIDKSTLNWDDKKMVCWQMLDVEHNSVDFTFEHIVDNKGFLHFIASNGSIFPMGSSPFIYSAYNVLPPDVTGGKYETVKLAPMVACCGNFHSFVYDETNKRMLYYEMISQNIKNNATLLKEDKFALKNHQIYWMQGYKEKLRNVIAKNLNDQKFYLYPYDYSASTEEAFEPVEIENGHLLEESAGMLDRTKQYVLDYQGGNFYFAYGDKLYVLRNNALEEVTILDPDNVLKDDEFNGFDPICLVTRYSTDSKIIIATYVDGIENSGKVYFLEPESAEPRNLKVRTYHKNMHRVKGVTKF